MFALKICRRKTGKQQARFAETLKDALPPVGHAVDFVLVEEDVQRASQHSFKRGEVLPDALDEFGDAALRVVAPRVGDEQVVVYELSVWAKLYLKRLPHRIQLRQHFLRTPAHLLK